MDIYDAAVHSFRVQLHIVLVDLQPCPGVFLNGGLGFLQDVPVPDLLLHLPDHFLQSPAGLFRPDGHTVLYAIYRIGAVPDLCLEVTIFSS